MTERERFNKLIEKVLAHEGGYVNIPGDAGGETKYGISKRSYPKEDIKNLTVERAKDIYFRDYWSKLKCGSIADDAIAQKLMDTGINCGTVPAVRILQRALNAVGKPVAIDGKISGELVSAVNSVAAIPLLAKMREYQKAHYIAIVDAKPSQSKFLRGWLNRAAS